MTETTMAFALAGLGGFNAHGAGFLQAARDNQVEPDLVTATSGQIVVLAAYLRGEPDLKNGLIDKSIEENPFAPLQIALLGYPGVFEPAVAEAMPDTDATLFRHGHQFFRRPLFSRTATSRRAQPRLSKAWLRLLMPATSASSSMPTTL